VSAFQEFARHAFAWLTAASWQIAVLVGLVAVITWGLQSASPRLRYGLWSLVLLKVFLPPSLTAPWSLGRWVIAPIGESLSAPRAGATSLPSESMANLRGAAVALGNQPTFMDDLPFAVLMFGIWLVGSVLFWLLVAWRYAGVVRMVASATALDEGPVRVEYERLVLELNLRRAPDLFVTTSLTSPFLFGLVQPRIVLSEPILQGLSEQQRRAILLHELMHFKHGDTYFGWLQVVGQSLFWFHPLVWWANRQLRHSRELVCDQAVLRQGRISAHSYGESIVRVLTASRGQSLVTGSLVGVFERGVNLYDRLENIMNYETRKSDFGRSSVLAVVACGVLLLPMAPGAMSAAADGTAPKIVSTSPAVGAKNVDPNLREITVTFDQDMGSGMSWTGLPPEFPPLDESGQPGWRKKRTCYLPVKLAAGAMYRVGINSSSHQNFKSASGTPAAPAAIYFTTTGASAEVQNQTRAPEVVSMEPKNGAADVDPKTDSLKVTFNMPMNSGMSWTGGGPTFPKIPDGKKPSWSADGLTCTLPVTLEPAHEYTLGLNSPSHKNFQSKSGVPLAPVTYKFRTRDSK
jgi:beta-lactamase regulating signal transducer with metallopeptidase domain